MSSKNKNILPNLGVLRGVLALLVVIYHLPLMTSNFGLPTYDGLPIFHKGFNAVWVFFSLSGFLIINLLYKEKIKSGQVSVKQFYGRRIFRIYPVYYIVLIFGIAFYHLILPEFGIVHEVNYTMAEAGFWCVFLLPNVFFTLFDPGGILSVLWSIGIEEQFYLIIAPVTKKINKNRFTLILFLFTIVYFIIYFNPYFDFFRRFRFMYFYFSLGGLMAILNEQKKIDFLIFNKPFRVILYGLFVLYFNTNIFEFGLEFLNHGFSAILFSLFILNFSSERELIIKNKFLNYLGDISYGIYMYHMIALYIILYLGMKLNLSVVIGDIGAILFFNITSIILTIILAHISFYYFEKRFIKMKKR